MHCHRLVSAFFSPQPAVVIRIHVIQKSPRPKGPASTTGNRLAATSDGDVVDPNLSNLQVERRRCLVMSRSKH